MASAANATRQEKRLNSTNAVKKETKDARDKRQKMLSSKEAAYNAGDVGSIPGLGRSPGGGNQPTPVFLPGESPWTEEPGGL